MSDELLIAIAMILSIVGCGYCALSQHQHWRVVAKSKELTLKKTRMKFLGFLTLSASFALYIVEVRLEFALLLWPLSITLGIFSVGMILAFRPSLLRILT